MGNGFSILIMLVVMMGLMFFMQRSQKKQADKRMESLNKLQKGYEVITIGGLYGTVDEVDTEKKTVVLDVDGVYLTFELTAIKTVLPLTEGITAVPATPGHIHRFAASRRTAQRKARVHPPTVRSSVRTSYYFCLKGFFYNL